MDGRERLTARDWTFLAICAAVFAAALFVILRWFGAAFPEASIEFRYDRDTSSAIAERVLHDQHVDLMPLKHAALFDADDTARIFLERSLGLERANALMRRDVHLWYWHHRWFKPLQEEEYSADIAPTGELVAYARRIPEARALPGVTADQARAIAEQFMARNGIAATDLQLVSQSERILPHRVQRIFAYDSRRVHPAGAPYRCSVTVDGNVISNFSQRVKVPEEWERNYGELRSKNQLAGKIDSIFLLITAIAILAVFIVRLLRGDLRIKLLLGIGLATLILNAAASMNSFPSTLAGYDTTQSYAAFIAQWLLFGVLLQAVGSAIVLMVLSASGEVLYRERLPEQLALPRLVPHRALTSKRVFRSFVLGYTMVAFFIAYQVIFYLVADRFGAWSPAELPYDETLSTAFPWVAVLFAGWFPALSEEFMSRAFSIPFFERLMRSRVAAVIVAAFIWGFGHATYPNQPFFIRGVEVGLAGVMIGVLFFRYGLLPLLIWHYTVDALYTALLLFRSHNTYYVFSAALASFVFAVPMLISIVLYLRNRGFVPDADLSNATVPLRPVPPPVVHEERYELPPPVATPRARVIVCIALIAVAVVLLTLRPDMPSDAIDFRTTRTQAEAIARARLPHTPPAHVAITPIDAFRSWDRNSGREDGGSPAGFDGVAATYLLQHGMTLRGLAGVFAHRVEAGTWTVRFFTPRVKDEYFVEVDPRTARAIGYHRYQDERNPGPRLAQADAQAIATRAFAAYGEDASRFDLKEALSFRQPNRLDWLFHFQERQPIVAEAYRRVSVRVAGSEVTQFATTIKIPDAAYREASRDTMLNVAIGTARLIAMVAVLAVIVTGFVIAARTKRPPWLRTALWAAPFVLIPLANAWAGWSRMLFSYETAVQWSTFLSGAITSIAGTTAAQAGLVMLAFAAILTIHPYAPALLTREGRARFGRDAVVAALTALAAAMVLRLVLQLLTSHFSAFAAVDDLTPPREVDLPLPAFFAAARALLVAVIGSGVLTLYHHALGTVRRAWLPAAITIGALFLTQVDAGSNTGQLVLSAVQAALVACTLWFVATRVLRDNPLAWPLALFTIPAAQSAFVMLGNHRADLIAQGWMLLALIAALLVFVAAPRAVEVAVVE